MKKQPTGERSPAVDLHGVKELDDEGFIEKLPERLALTARPSRLTGAVATLATGFDPE